MSGVWKGLTREENWAIDRQIYQNKIDDAKVALAASESARVAEAKAREAEAMARAEAEAKARQAEATRKADNEFTDILLDQNRIDDLKRAAKDPEFKQQLMKELGLI